MENDVLKYALDAEICRQVREAIPSTPRYVVLSRVVETVCNYLNLPVTSLPDYKNTIRLDESLKTLVQECWHLRGDDSHEELEKMLSKDYHKPCDVVRFVGILWKRISKPVPSTNFVSKLYEFLAVDGYLGEDLKKYVEHLKIASSTNDAKSIHVHAVRQMYRKGMVENPPDMYSVLQTAFGLRPCDTQRDEELKIFYVKLVGDALEKIREWKMQQSQEDSKRKQSTMTKKRKLERDQEESEGKLQQAPQKKRSRKNENPVKVAIDTNESLNEYPVRETVFENEYPVRETVFENENPVREAASPVFESDSSSSSSESESEDEEAQTP